MTGRIGKKLAKHPPLTEAVMNSVFERNDLEGLRRSLVEQIAVEVCRSIVVADLAEELAKERSAEVLSHVRSAITAKLR